MLLYCLARLCAMRDVSASFLPPLYDPSFVILFSHPGRTELPDEWFVRVYPQP